MTKVYQKVQVFYWSIKFEVEISQAPKSSEKTAKEKLVKQNPVYRLIDSPIGIDIELA